ncbi:hypothetical protein SB00610_04782 [Klebsiella quasipneumoniae subsp. similipneumoniae]|nr:hypothetical protein SB00610_04782 [Klebsiella quasipneumoniae subsp. similipneumoniae]
MIIKLQQRAIAVDAADAENAEVETELRDKIEGSFSDDPAVAAAQFAAGKNNAEVLFHHQRVGDVKVIGHNPQIVVIEQGVRHRFRRGSDIDKQLRPVRDLAGHPPGDTLFLRRLGRFAIVPGGVHRAGGQRRAAVVAEDHFLFG